MLDKKVTVVLLTLRYVGRNRFSELHNISRALQFLWEGVLCCRRDVEIAYCVSKIVKVWKTHAKVCSRHLLLLLFRSVAPVPGNAQQEL